MENKDHNTHDLSALLGKVQQQGPDAFAAGLPQEKPVVPLGLRKLCNGGDVLQIKKYLTWTNSFPEKNDLVARFTDARTTSVKEMMEDEALELINFFKERNDRMNTMRRKIFYHCHNMKWEVPGGKVDEQRLDHWCLHNGQFKKSLQLHNYNELTALVTQFQNVYRSYLKSFKK